MHGHQDPTFLTFFSNTVSVTVLNYSLLHTIVSMLTSPTTVRQVWLQVPYNNVLTTMVTKLNH